MKTKHVLTSFTRNLLLLLISFLSACSDSSSACDVLTKTVFRNGQDGYKIFRIPAIVRAANGDVLAFCEARSGGDASEIDLVLKRSSDGGKTWNALEVVQENDDFRDFFEATKTNISIGNPAPVVDCLDPRNPGRIWLPFTLENDRVFVTFSDDHGKTWAARREITDDVKKEKWGWYATGPVHSIQLLHGDHKGRLVIPCDHRLGLDGHDRGALGAHVIVSDDHGMSWRLGAVDATYDDDLNANETTVVELSDGRLYFNTRDHAGKAAGTRGEAFSSDGGDSFDRWEDDTYKYFRPSSKQLDPPVVQCAMIRAASTIDGDQANLIFFSGPDENGPTGKGRSDLRIRISMDEASTWQDGPLIHEGPAAYSDLVVLEGNRIGVLFEAGSKGTKTYDRIDFVVLELSDNAKPNPNTIGPGSNELNPMDEQPNSRLAKQASLEKSLGITLVTAASDVLDSTKLNKIAFKTANLKSIEAYSDLFLDEFQIYPPEFVKRTGLKRVVLCRELSWDGQLRTAIPDTRHKTLYLDVVRGSDNDRYMRQVIHHEFFHIVDRCDDGLLYRDDGWAKQNPDDFNYGDGGRNAQNIKTTSLLTNKYPGFLNHYSTTGVEEDKAELFCHMIVNPAYVKNRVAKDRVLKAKIGMMKALLRRFCPEMNAGFWEKSDLKRRKPKSKASNTHKILGQS